MSNKLKGFKARLAELEYKMRVRDLKPRMEALGITDEM
jgi:hypothetical protein